MALALPLFQRYHAAAGAGACKAALQALGLRAAAGDASPSASAPDVLHLEYLDGKTPGSADAAAAAQAVTKALAKSVDGNYFVGVDLGDCGVFAEAVGKVHAAVHAHSEGSGCEDPAATACLSPNRWTLCLSVLRIYSPDELTEITAILSDELAQGGFADMRLDFSGLRALGPTKLVAALAPADNDRLAQLAARLHARLVTWAAARPALPHVTVVKFSYPFGDKKAKATATQAAGKLALHKVDWGAKGIGFHAAGAGPVGVRLYQMHAGGGVAMGDARYGVAWPAVGAEAEAA